MFYMAIVDTSKTNDDDIDSGDDTDEERMGILFTTLKSMHDRLSILESAYSYAQTPKPRP